MSNFPRFGRARQRPSAVAPPFSAAAQPPAAERKPEILSFAPATTTQTLQPLEPNYQSPPASPPRESPRRISTPEKKATSPFVSPKYGASVARVVSPLPAKAKLPSPGSLPNEHYVERVTKTITPPRSPTKSRRTTTPPLSPLALPRSHVTSVNGTTTQPRRIQPEVEQKSIVYKKTAEKPAKSNRPSEYGSGGGESIPKHKQAAEAITLTGHNVGAVMEINQSSPGHRLGGEITKKDKTEGGDGVRRGNDEKKTGEKKKPPMTTFMNSNFQSVNNSVLYDTACNHRDPGLHIAFSGAADGDGATVDGHKNYKP